MSRGACLQVELEEARAYLLGREPFRREDGRIDYRCAGEPVEAYVGKGGAVEETEGRKCLCNALMANVGHAQVRDDGAAERALITIGSDLAPVRTLLGDRPGYSAADVVAFLRPPDRTA